MIRRNFFKHFWCYNPFISADARVLNNCSFAKKSCDYSREKNEHCRKNSLSVTLLKRLLILLLLYCVQLVTMNLFFFTLSPVWQWDKENISGVLKNYYVWIVWCVKSISPKVSCLHLKNPWFWALHWIQTKKNIHHTSRVLYFTFQLGLFSPQRNPSPVDHWRA